MFPSTHPPPPSYHTHLPFPAGGAVLGFGGYIPLSLAATSLEAHTHSPAGWWGDPSLDSGVRFTGSPAFPSCCLLLSIPKIDSLDKFMHLSSCLNTDPFVLLFHLPSNRGLIPGWGKFAGEGIGYPLQYSWASLVAHLLKNPPAMWETWV